MLNYIILYGCVGNNKMQNTTRSKDDALFSIDKLIYTYKP